MDREQTSYDDWENQVSAYLGKQVEPFERQLLHPLYMNGMEPEFAAQRMREWMGM